MTYDKRKFDKAIRELARIVRSAEERGEGGKARESLFYLKKVLRDLRDREN